MNTHADKTQENKSQSVANETSQKQSGGASTFQFVDNRPEAVAQRKLQEMTNNSSQVSQLRAFQEMANKSPQAKQAAQLQVMANNHSAQQQNPIQRVAVATGENEKAIIKASIESAVALMNEKYIALFKNDQTTVDAAMTYLGLNRNNAMSLVNALMGSMNTNKAGMVAGSEVDWDDDGFASAIVGNINGLEVNKAFLEADLSGVDSRTSTMIHESAHIFRNANEQVEFENDIIGVSGATITPDNTEVYDDAQLLDLPVTLRQHNAQNVEKFFTS